MYQHWVSDCALYDKGGWVGGLQISHLKQVLVLKMAAKAVSLAKSLKVNFAQGQNPYSALGVQLRTL